MEKKIIEKKFNFVYITTNLINGKQYVGEHSSNDLNYVKTKRYLGSGKILYNAIQKEGRENFKREILEFFATKQEAFDAQEKYIIQFNTLSPNGYNIDPKGGSRPTYSPSKESKEKISKANTGRKLSEEHKEKLRKSSKGRIKSKEEREKLSKGATGRIKSKEEREKISNARRGKPTTTGPRIDLIGVKNGMFGRCAYDIWVEKYGVEEADIKNKETSKRKSESLKGKTKNLIWINLENKHKRIKENELNYWLSMGWEKGFSEERKNKQSLKEKSKNLIWINLNNVHKKINIGELNIWIDNGWKKGFSENRKKNISIKMKGKCYTLKNNYIKKNVPKFGMSNYDMLDKYYEFEYFISRNNHNKFNGICHGQNNGMYGISLYEKWLEKYDVEIANKKYEQWKLNIKNSNVKKIIWMHHKILNLCEKINRNKIEEYLNEGWEYGRLNFKMINLPEIVNCPHCNKSGRYNLMKRWHFDNCTLINKNVVKIKRVWMFNKILNTNKMINKTDILIYLDKGWEFGRLNKF